MKPDVLSAQLNRQLLFLDVSIGQLSLGLGKLIVSEAKLLLESLFLLAHGVLLCLYLLKFDSLVDVGGMIS